MLVGRLERGLEVEKLPPLLLVDEVVQRARAGDGVGCVRRGPVARGARDGDVVEVVLEGVVLRPYVPEFYVPSSRIEALRPLRQNFKLQSRS